MNEQVCITVLIENSVNARGLKAEHGLAFHIEISGRRLLFDTGQTALLLENAASLGLPLGDLCAVVLSHGHYDHTGGLTAVRGAAPQVRLFLHPAALLPKFSGNTDGSARSVGMNEASVQTVREAAEAAVWTTKPTEVLDGIFVTGEIPRRNSFEDTGGRFFLDEACTQPDPLLDDQALFFDTRDGLVVLLGCAHAGVVNTLEYIQYITGGRPIHAILGGLHLRVAGPERIERTIEAFQRWHIQRIAPAHCTGVSAVARLRTAFPEKCFSCAVGTRMVFQ